MTIRKKALKSVLGLPVVPVAEGAAVQVQGFGGRAGSPAVHVQFEEEARAPVEPEVPTVPVLGLPVGPVAEGAAEQVQGFGVRAGSLAAHVQFEGNAGAPAEPERPLVALGAEAAEVHVHCPGGDVLAEVVGGHVLGQGSPPEVLAQTVPHSAGPRLGDADSWVEGAGLGEQV